MAGLRLLRFWNPKGRARSFLTGNRFAQLLGGLNIGSDMFTAKVDAYGIAGGQARSVSLSCTGRQEGSSTGQVAAAVAQSIVEESKPHGVHHIHEIFTLDAVRMRLPEDSAVVVKSR